MTIHSNKTANLAEIIPDKTRLCLNCGSCSGICPVADQLNYTPRWLINSIRSMVYNIEWPQILDGKLAMGEKPPDQSGTIPEFLVNRIFQCTLCAKCETLCASNIPLLDFWKNIRSLIYNEGLWPEPFQLIKNQLDKTRNIFGMPPDTRNDWAFNIEDELEEHVGKKASVGYFVGCNTCYKGANAPIGEALVGILKNSNTDFTILGEEEWCCGAPYELTGARPLIEEYTTHNVKKMKALGVKTIVTGCPGCYKTWKYEYPQILGGDTGLKVLHTVEWVDELITTGKIVLKNPIEGKTKITYHDPCELGRHCEIYDAPRNILHRIPKLKFEEMDKTREISNCCGGGGALRILDEKLSLDLAGNRIREAEAINAHILASACPACKINLSDAANNMKSEIEVVDVLELVVKSAGFDL